MLDFPRVSDEFQGLHSSVNTTCLLRLFVMVQTWSSISNTRDMTQMYIYSVLKPKPAHTWSGDLLSVINSSESDFTSRLNHVHKLEIFKSRESSSPSHSSLAKLHLAMLPGSLVIREGRNVVYRPTFRRPSSVATLSNALHPHPQSLISHCLDKHYLSSGSLMT